MANEQQMQEDADGKGTNFRSDISDTVDLCQGEDFLFQFLEGGHKICKATDVDHNMGCKYKSDTQVQIGKGAYYLCNAVKQFTQLEDSK